MAADGFANCSPATTKNPRIPSEDASSCEATTFSTIVVHRSVRKERERSFPTNVWSSIITGIYGAGLNAGARGSFINSNIMAPFMKTYRSMLTNNSTVQLETVLYSTAQAVLV